MKGYNVLVVDDDKAIVEAIEIYLRGEGYNIFKAYDGAEALEVIKEEEIHLVIMDIMMPKLDGFSSYKEIKKIKDIPVLMLSARSEEYDKLFGFEIGIDDYVTKPFSPKELMARLNVIVNRNNKVEENNTMEFEGLKIDLDGRVVFVDDEIVELTPKEYDLLVYMVKNKNIALSRDKLLNQVWGYDFYGEDRTVDTHIKMLRNSIKEYRKFIITVRGVGYKFDTRN